MGKNKTPETHLILPSPPSVLPIVDTHTHLLSTYEEYKRKYPTGKFVASLSEFVEGFYVGVDAIVDVWCEAPVRSEWKEIADSGFAGVEYWFVMGKFLNLCDLEKGADRGGRWR